ncbi:MAG: hypothetical protein Q8R98_05325, partial [Rubrivivax sp.]|nr:hypothetical protein [Rubrivivax sp.]
MAENESFFRKVVRFVANPATDWTDLSTRQEDTKELELEKSELKAMIERKRRNDFVRKREFDMLRRVRREGLSPEQLATLGTSSRLDDSESRAPEAAAARPDGVKAKIDEIEQQMVGDAGFNASSRTRGPASSSPPYSDSVANGGQAPRTPAYDNPFRSPAPAPLPDIHLPPSAAPAPVQMATGLPPLAPMSPVSFDAAMPAPVAASPAPPPFTAPGHSASPPTPGENSDFSSPFAVEVSEVMHDPELDEAVIAFANADFSQCEEALQRITSVGGDRSQHAETWLVLFDLYRATGQQQRFESLALDYAQQFGWSAPQWYSLPKLVADALADEPVMPSSSSSSRLPGDVGWVCPEQLDIEALARLRSQT